MRIGFVGTGEITQAIVTGISKTDLATTPIHVSPRNETVAARLAERHANVTVAAGNQDVVDNADMVFLAIRPQIAEEVVRALRFRADHHVVSLVAATPLDRLTTWINAPVRLAQAIPLPFVRNAERRHRHPSAGCGCRGDLLPPRHGDRGRQQDRIRSPGRRKRADGHLLRHPRSRHQMLESKGLAYDSGRAYLNQMFGALSASAGEHPDKSFDELRSEFSTKGGLNEQAYTNFAGDGGVRALADALDSVFNRIRHAN